MGDIPRHFHVIQAPLGMFKEQLLVESYLEEGSTINTFRTTYLRPVQLGFLHRG